MSEALTIILEQLERLEPGEETVVMDAVYPQRDRRVCAQAAAGMKDSEIARIWHITRQRVGQIRDRQGVALA